MNMDFSNYCIWIIISSTLILISLVAFFWYWINCYYSSKSEKELSENEHKLKILQINNEQSKLKTENEIIKRHLEHCYKVLSEKGKFDEEEIKYSKDFIQKVRFPLPNQQTGKND